MNGYFVNRVAQAKLGGAMWLDQLKVLRERLEVQDDEACQDKAREVQVVMDAVQAQVDKL